MSDTYERIARASELMNLATSASELMNLALTMSTGLDEVSKKESRLLDHWTFAPKYVRGKLGVTRMSFTTGIGGSTRPTRLIFLPSHNFISAPPSGMEELWMKKYLRELWKPPCSEAMESYRLIRVTTRGAYTFRDQVFACRRSNTSMTVTGRRC